MKRCELSFSDFLAPATHNKPTVDRCSDLRLFLEEGINTNLYLRPAGAHERAREASFIARRVPQRYTWARNRQIGDLKGDQNGSNQTAGSAGGNLRLLRE